MSATPSGDPIEALTAAATAIAQKIDKDARSRKVWLGTIAVLVIAGIVIGCQQLQLQQGSRERGLQNREIIQRIEAQNAVITDCTSSTGKCYRTNQARTAQLLMRVREDMVFVAECLRATETDAQLQRCVLDKAGAAQP